MSDQQTAVEKKPNNREIATIILGVVVIAICIANRESVKVDLIVDTWKMPLIILIVACLAIGGAGGFLTARRRAKAKDDE